MVLYPQTTSRGYRMEPRKAPETVDYFVHEGIVARQERHIKRLWILCIIIFLALIATNAGWIWYESQWEDQVITQDVDTGVGSAYVSGTGDVYGDGTADY